MAKRVAPYILPAVATAVKARPKLERAWKIAVNMRNRFRRPSFTSTKTRGPAMEYVNTPSEGNSTSYFTRKALRLRGFKKRMLKASPLQLRKTELVDSLSWPYGRQGVILFTHNRSTELTQLAQQIPGNTLTTQMLLQSTKIHYMIASGSKAAIKMRIYEGCFKKDLAAAFDPLRMWQDGMTDTGSTQSVTNIDSKPFSSIGFMKQCHISKVTNVFIPQGRTHEHYVTYNYNKIYNREELNLSGNAYLKGWTRFVMFVGYGEPVADTDTDVSTASGRILVIGTKTQRYRFSTPTNYSASYVQSIPVTGLSAERLFDEGSGEIEVNTVL